jgi:hypothetical protein
VKGTEIWGGRVQEYGVPKGTEIWGIKNRDKKAGFQKSTEIWGVSKVQRYGVKSEAIWGGLRCAKGEEETFAFLHLIL